MSEEQEILEAMRALLGQMRDGKPNDRGEKDRYFAISITDMEKVLAFFKTYVVGPS